MDPLSIALLAINGLRTVMGNPALGGGSSVRLDQASELLGILGTLLQQGDESLDDLREFTKIIEAMAAQGREPTPTEWGILRQRSDAAHARLQAVKEELLREEEEMDDEVPTPPLPVPGPTPITEPVSTSEEGETETEESIVDPTEEETNE